MVARNALNVFETAPAAESDSPIVAIAVPTARTVPIDVSTVRTGALVTAISASRMPSRSVSRLRSTPRSVSAAAVARRLASLVRRRRRWPVNA